MKRADALKYVGVDVEQYNGCVEFYAKVLKDHFGKDLNLPSDTQSWAKAKDMHNKLLEHFKEVEEGEESDLILFTYPRNKETVQMYHAGMLVSVGNKHGYVLHKERNHTSCIEELRHMTSDIRGYSIVGFYRAINA